MSKEIRNSIFNLSEGTGIGIQTWTPQIPLGGETPKLWNDGNDKSTMFTDTAMTTLVINDGDSIAAWADKSGNNNNAIQSTLGNRPTYKTNILNGKSVLSFDCAAYNTLVVDIVNSIPQNASVTVFVLAKINNYSTSGGARKAISFKGGVGALGWAASVNVSYTLGNGVRFTKLGVADTVLPIPILDDKSYSLLTFKFDSSFDCSSYNNGDLRSFVASAADCLTGNREFIIGGGVNSTESWDGNIAEVLVYDEELTDDEIIKVSGYFIRKWDIKTPIKNASNYLTTPTSDGSGEAVHPGVIYSSSGWNGYKYWMAITPFPNADSSKENPEILCSNDGNTWVVPTGLTNPIMPKPAGSAYNSDTDLILAGITLYCIWRETLLATYDKIYLSSSIDGVTWTEKELLIEGAYGGILSPTIIFDGTNYILYYVDRVSTAVIKYATCSTVNGTYTVVGAITITDPWTATTIFHLTVRKEGSVYKMILQLIGEYNLLFTSSDGINWGMDVNFMLKKSASNWDSTDIYRSTFIDMGSYLDIWYSARKGTSPQVWHIGRTKY